MPEPNRRIWILIDRFADRNVSEFVKMINLESVQKLNRLFHIDKRSGHYPKPSTDIIQKISLTFPEVNSNWLLNGEGAMVSTKPNIDSEIKAYINRVGSEAMPVDLVDETEVTKNQSDNEFRDLDNGMVLMSMPLVPEYAYASYPHGWKDPEYIVELPRYNIVLPKNEKGRFRAFEVRGDSMDDGSRNAICHGDVAIGRFVEPDLWRHKLFINGGTDYVIVTHDGLIIKRIIKHDIKEGIITCASVNPDKNEYPDFPVRLSEVYELYFIRKIDRDWNRR